jgi:acyl-CoA synthetase (AMP-forming)/AMP-acid ligase II
MGQATTGLYGLLGSRCRGLKIHEWKKGEGLRSYGAPSTFSGLAPFGSGYLVAEAPTVPQLWGALYSALTQRQVLVLLPPSSPLEREKLLGQLPASAPAGAVLALFTSGSAGEPKAVFHGEASLLTSARQLAAAFPGTGPTLSLLAPWGMAGLVFHCLLPAARGGSDLLFSGEPLLDWAGDALRLARDLKLELLTLNPFLADMLLRAGLGKELAETEVVSLTAPLKAELRRRFQSSTGRALREIYGMTEAAGPVLLEGKSLGAETALSADGELLLRGEQLFLGYSAGDEFRAREEWYATGDIFRDEAGQLVHQARTRELIDLGGRKVAPALIEAAFEGMPELGECLAFAKNLAGVERPAFAYARAQGCALSREALSALVEARAKALLSPELRPAWWMEIEKVPRLKNGKPDRRAAALV